MTTWYVRPNINHGVTRNGASYATAWGGWSEIIWGGAGVVAGDTLYVCGSHSYSAQLNIGTHGATVSSRVTIRGDYESDPGSITFTAAFILVNRNYTTIKNLPITAGTLYCIYMFGALTGITVEGCTLNGGVGQPIINMSGANGNSFVDILITDSTFTGGSGSSLGSAISYKVTKGLTPEESPISSLNRVTITNNRFAGCSSTRAVVDLWVENGGHASSKLADIIVSGNTYTDCIGVAIEVLGPDEYGRNTGIRVTDNTIHNQVASSANIGGGMAIGGFAPSLTADFGANIIARNEGYVLHGPTGLINIFYGTYQIFSNVAEDLTTDTIDGSGVLFDHGNNNCAAFGNRFSRLIGKPGVYYSGNGITVLDSTNIEVYGNHVEDAYCGVHIGNKAGGQSSNIHNNIFLRCAMGVDVLSTADMATNMVRNNLFTATGATASVRVAGGPWTGESYNAFRSFGAASGHTLAGTTITTDPLIGSDGRPLAGSPLIEAGMYLGGKGADYKTFRNPPCIGAYEYVRPRAARA